MTKERAKYILANTLFGGSLKYSFSGRYGSFNAPTYKDGLTAKEVYVVRSVWDGMKDNASFADALRKIAKKGV